MDLRKLKKLIDLVQESGIGEVTIELPHRITGKIEVYNSEGTLVLSDRMEGKTYELQASSLKNSDSALYFVRVSSADNNYTFKLIKD